MIKAIIMHNTDISCYHVLFIDYYSYYIFKNVKKNRTSAFLQIIKAYIHGYGKVK